MTKGTEDYEEGRRDGQILSLEIAVRELTTDLKKLKIYVYMLYGAIALVQFAPELKRFLGD